MKLSVKLNHHLSPRLESVNTCRESSTADQKLFLPWSFGAMKKSQDIFQIPEHLFQTLKNMGLLPNLLAEASLITCFQWCQWDLCITSLKLTAENFGFMSHSCIVGGECLQPGAWGFSFKVNTCCFSFPAALWKKFCYFCSKSFNSGDIMYNIPFLLTSKSQHKIHVVFHIHHRMWQIYSYKNSSSFNASWLHQLKYIYASNTSFCKPRQ